MVGNEAGEMQIPQGVLDFLATQRVLTVATAAPNAVPHANSFLFVNDGPELYFWTKPETTTAKHVGQNPAVSFTIDAYEEDLAGLQGLQGTGACTVLLDGRRIAEVAGLFGDKYSDLAPGATMSISFFRIAPVMLTFTDNTGKGAETRPGDFGASFHNEQVYSVYADLPRAALESVTGQLLPTTVEAGEVLVNQGAPADKFFIVVDGELEVLREENGDQSSLGTLGSGQFYGELSVLRDRPRRATLRAARASSLLSMDRDEFKQLVAGALGSTAEFDQVVRNRLFPSGDDS